MTKKFEPKRESPKKVYPTLREKIRACNTECTHKPKCYNEEVNWTKTDGGRKGELQGGTGNFTVKRGQKGWRTWKVREKGRKNSDVRKKGGTGTGHPNILTRTGVTIPIAKKATREGKTIQTRGGARTERYEGKN